MMNQMKLFIKLFIFLSAIPAFSQQKQTLITINNKNISVEEFENLYTKNLDLVQDPAQKDIDNYKNLFVDFKLELEDAYQLKYDTLASFKKEWKQYRDELAKKYLSDEEVINTLTKEAYNRMKEDVKVSHILFKLPQGASPQDTLKAYKKAWDIYKKAISGKDFHKLARTYSQDPSVSKNGGNLDFINVFHTVYPFESMAYNTPKGKISKPFRTKFGYHILKVEDRRKARGEIEVAHIFIRDNKTNPAEAKQQIQKIYQKLIKKEDRFENLARKYSEDKSSARSGGRLRKFGIREMIPEFEDQAFALNKPGDISKAFHSRYGWHIIKLIKKYPLPEFKQIKNEIRQRVSRDERAKVGKEKLYMKIKDIYKVDETPLIDRIIKKVDEAFFINKWKIPQDKLSHKTLFIINRDKQVSVNDFYKYLYRHQLKNPEKKGQKRKLITQLYEDFKKQELLKYYDQHLEKLYPEFGQIVKEYKEGLLLFNIKSDKVWNKSVQDTIGVKKFFLDHKEKYRVPEKYIVFVGQTHSKKTAKKLEKAFRKNWDFDQIKKNFADKDLILQKKMITQKDTLFKTHQLKTKNTARYKDHNEYIIAHIHKLERSHIPKLEEIKGKVINDFQEYLEKEWLKQLKKKYPVIIDNKNWQKIREKYKN